MTEPRSVAFGVDWEPDPEELRVVRDYLIHQPEQGDWAWEDHCEGLAGGILQALHVLRQSGHGLACDDDCRYRYICEAGHTTVTSKARYDVCTAVLPVGGTVPGLSCGAPIDYRVIPYDEEELDQ